MFLNNLNRLNYHLTFHGLLNNFYVKSRSNSSMFMNKSFASNLNEDNFDLEKSSRDELNEELNLSTSELPSNLIPSTSAYLEMIRELKRSAEQTYLMIFSAKDQNKTIKLPDKLKFKNNDYFNVKKRNMCLIDLDCDKKLIDYLSVNYFNENQLSSNDRISRDLRFRYIKGPFLKCKYLIESENEINFANYDPIKFNYSELNRYSNSTDQLDYLLKRFKISERERRIKFTLINYLEQNICSGIFKEFELLPFGSSFTGLGCNFSDLDLILFPKQLNKSELNESDELSEFKHTNSLDYIYGMKPLNNATINLFLQIIKRLTDLLPGIHVDMHIPHAKVPILKLACPFVNVSIDVSISLNSTNNGVILMSQILYSYSKLYPLLQKLYVILRLWATENSVVNHKQPSNHLKNFTLLMLIISYLQNRKQPLLPSMQSILINNEQAINECLINNTTVDLFDLIPEFFEFVSNCNFSRINIDLYNGRLARNLSSQAMFIKNPFDIYNSNMSKNMIPKTVINLKKVAANSLNAYDKSNLTSLFNVNQIRVPIF